MARAHQDRPDARGHSALQVPQVVPDEPRSGEIKAEIGRGPQDQAGARFPAVTIFVGSVRAIINGVDPAAAPPDRLPHQPMNLFNPFPADEPPVDAGLVADDDHGMGPGCQNAERFEDPRQELKFRPGLDVVGPVAVDHAVAVKENGRTTPRHIVDVP